MREYDRNLMQARYDNVVQVLSSWFANCSVRDLSAALKKAETMLRMGASTMAAINMASDMMTRRDQNGQDNLHRYWEQRQNVARLRAWEEKRRALSSGTVQVYPIPDNW